MAASKNLVVNVLLCPLAALLKRAELLEEYLNLGLEVQVFQLLIGLIRLGELRESLAIAGRIQQCLGFQRLILNRN